MSNEEPKLASVLDFGQGDDDVVQEMIKGLAMLEEGYYTLINYGEEWWRDTMNQDVWYNEAMEKEWYKVDWETFETALEMMIKLTIGTYIRPQPFSKALEELKKAGEGFRPRAEKKVEEKP